MATIAIPNEVGVPSSLTVDLAKARVNLAALLARRGKELSQQARESAKLLRDYYHHQLQVAKRPDTIISDKLAKDEETREALQNGLASISRTKPRFSGTSEQLVSHLIDLLSTLADEAQGFGPTEGEELHKLLHSLEPEPPTWASNDKIAKLSESLDVS